MNRYERNAGRRPIVRLALAGLMAFAAAGSVSGQTWPQKPIHVVVTSSAGSTGDTLIRALADPLGKALGQPLVIENVPGSGGVIGTERFVRAPKDGYTLGVISNNHAINPNIYRTIPFDSRKDITPISVLGTTPVVLVVDPAVPAKNVPELIALARAKPGALNYGSAGNGTVLHLAGVLFTSEAEIDVRHVPYKNLAQMTSDLMGGQIEMGFAGIAAVVNRLNAEVTTALATREVQETLAAQGVATVGSSPQAATRFIAGEMDKHSELVKRSGATLE